MDASIGYTFGSRHNHERPNENPAPGAYDVNGVDVIDHSAPAYSFGLRPDLSRPSDIPAPNAYAAPHVEHPIAYSFGVKPDVKNTFIVPGPGAYSPEEADKTGVSHSFGVKHHQAKLSQTPGMYCLDWCF